MEQIGKALSPPKPGCSLILEDWMFDLKDSKGKRLTDTALHLYALIYGFSKHRAGIYFGTSSYTQARLRASLSAIKSAFRLLKDAGLIANVESQAEFGGQRRGWSVLPLNDDKRRTSVGGQNLTPLEPDSGETDAATSGSITPSSENPQVSDTDVEDQSPICTQYNHDDDDNRTPVGGQNLTPCGRNLAPEGQNLTSEGSESDPSFDSFSQVAKENSTPETKGNPKPNRKDEYKDPLPYSNASSEDGASEEAYDGARRLMAESLNRTTPLPRVASCIEQCFAKGYAIDDILSGYRAYIAAYKAEHDTPRYVMRLDTFLTSPKGLAFFARPSQARRAPKQHAPAPDRSTDARAEAQAAARRDHPEYAEMWRELAEIGYEQITLAFTPRTATDDRGMRLQSDTSREAAKRELEKRKQAVMARMRAWEQEHGLPKEVVADAA